MIDMIQIYFHQNQNKLQAIASASGFVVFSQLNFELYLNLENRVSFFGKPFSIVAKEGFLWNNSR